MQTRMKVRWTVLGFCIASYITPLLVYEGETYSELNNEGPDLNRSLRIIVVVLSPTETRYPLHILCYQHRSLQCKKPNKYDMP